MRAAWLPVLALVMGCLQDPAAPTARHEVTATVPASFPPAAAPAPAAPPGPMSLPNRCTLALETPIPTAVGKTGVAHLTMRPSNGYHVNREAPIEVRVASNDLDLPREKLGRADAHVLGPSEIKIDIPFSARARGKKHLALEARFGMCSDTRCSECRGSSEVDAVVD